MRSLFSFSTAQTEKNSWKKFVKTSDEFVTRLAMLCCAMLATTATKFIQIELA